MKKLIYWSTGKTKGVYEDGTEETKGVYEDGTEVRAEEFEYPEKEITMDELIAELLEEARKL